MKSCNCNLAAGGAVLILAALGGFFLGYTIDPLVADGYYKMSYVRLLFKGAHSHGMLFGLFNLVIGLLLPRLGLRERGKRWLASTGLVALFLPLGLLLRGFTHPSKVFLPMGGIGGFALIIASALIIAGTLKMARSNSDNN